MSIDNNAFLLGTASWLRALTGTPVVNWTPRLGYFGSITPLRRIGLPEVATSAALFLASSENTAGINLPVAGGSVAI